MINEVIIYGYNEYALQIAKQIRNEYQRVHLFVLEAFECEALKEYGLEASLFDLGDEWEEVEREYHLDSLMIFCALEDDANNIFLTISLRAAFEQVHIVALAKNQESANKLKMAGANKVMPILQTTVNIITELLEKPVVTDVLHDILHEQSDIKMAQISVREGSPIVGKRLHDILWHEEYGVIILAVIDLEMGTSFVFTAKGYNHHIDPGDMLIIVGYENEINAFEKEAGEASEHNWHHRGR